MNDYPEIIVPFKLRESFIRAHPEWLFLYGDAYLNKGGLGQGATFHGEPNTYRIPTCYKYCSNPTYFDDKNPDCLVYLNEALNNIPQTYQAIIPCPKIGMGASRMQEFAPKLFKYMHEKLREIQYPNISWDFTLR